MSLAKGGLVCGPVWTIVGAVGNCSVPNELITRIGALAMEDHRNASTAAERTQIELHYREAVQLADEVALWLAASREDTIRATKAAAPRALARLPRGYHIFRSYLLSVTQEFRRLEINFDRYAKMTNLHAHALERLRQKRGARAVELDDMEGSPDLVAGFDPGLDQNALLPYQLDTYDAAGAWTLAKLGMPLPFTLTNVLLMQRLRDAQAVRIDAMNQTTQDQLRRTLDQWEGDWEDEDDLGRASAALGAAVAGYWSWSRLFRVGLIVVTEMAIARVAGTRDTGGRNGVTGYLYDGDEGENSCDECLGYLGQIFSADEIDSVLPTHPRCSHWPSPVELAPEDVPEEWWTGA